MYTSGTEGHLSHNCPQRRSVPAETRGRPKQQSQRQQQQKTSAVQAEWMEPEQDVKYCSPAETPPAKQRRDLEEKLATVKLQMMKEKVSLPSTPQERKQIQGVSGSPVCRPYTKVNIQGMQVEAG